MAEVAAVRQILAGTVRAVVCGGAGRRRQAQGVEVAVTMLG
jgi:hypothetical protein